MWIDRLITNIKSGVSKLQRPKDKSCPDCGGAFPEFYFTQKGVCQACNKKSDAYNSMGYPRIQHAKERDEK